MLLKFKSFSLQISNKQHSIIKDCMGETKFEESVNYLIILGICEIVANRLLVTRNNEKNYDSWVSHYSDSDNNTDSTNVYTKKYLCNFSKNGINSTKSVDITTIRFLLWFSINRSLLSKEEEFQNYIDNCKLNDNGTIVIDYNYAINEQFMLWFDQNYFLNSYHIVEENKNNLN